MNKFTLFIKATLLFFLIIAKSQASYISFQANDELPPFNDTTINAPFVQDIDGQMIKAGQTIPKNVNLEIAEESHQNSAIFTPTTVPNNIGIIALILFVVFICLIRKSNNLI